MLPFLWADNAEHCFVGSTPERLFARDDRQLFTEALAGTAPVSDNPSENDERANWLLNDEKNLNENWLVVEDISQNISHLVEQITVDDVALKPLRKVQHLIRKMQAKLTALCTDADLLKAIHPTAAVSGLPQQQAKKALAEIETLIVLVCRNVRLDDPKSLGILCHHSFGFLLEKSKCVYLLEPVL